MRIALFSWEAVYSVYVGGVAFHVTELACALQRKGHEVHVFTRMGQHDHSKYECIHGVHYHRCPFGAHPDFVEEIHHMCRAFCEAFFATEDHVGRFDIIHAHDWLAAPVLGWIRQGRGHKAIFTMHSTEYGRCGNNNYGGNSQRVRSLEWLGCYESDAVIAVSHTLKKEVQWLYSVPDWKMGVIYNGIDYRQFDGWLEPAAVKRMYEIGPMDPMVLFVGRMVYQKGPDLLVTAIPYILNSIPNAKFVFVGDGEMRDAVQEQALHMGVNHACRFLGHVKGWRLKDLFKSTDCVCVPSRNEPFGIVILEAWSSGKPVVATTVGGPSEIVWHEINGLKIDPNPESIAWGVGSMFEDFDDARWMGRNGRVAAETVFSWDIIADEVLAVYNSV